MKYLKSKIKKRDFVEVVRYPVKESRYGYCAGYSEYIGRTGYVESADGMHIFVKGLGGCYQPEQLKKVKVYPTKG